MKDYRVDIRIKNNLLYQKILGAGFNNPAHFIKEAGFNPQSTYNALGLRMSVYGKRFQLREFPRKLGEYFLCPPTELFPEEVWYEALEETTASVEVSSDDVRKLSGDMSIERLEHLVDLNKLLKKPLSGLNPQQIKVIHMRYVQGMTLEECARELGVSRVRIRQVEMKALRLLRHPTRSEQLRPLLKSLGCE